MFRNLHFLLKHQAVRQENANTAAQCSEWETRGISLADKIDHELWYLQHNCIGYTIV